MISTETTSPQPMISILCAQVKSNYFKFPHLDIWTKERDAYNFHGTNPVITHAPCAQWSRLRAFAKDNVKEKELAYHCFELVKTNGGIFEHPEGSAFFKEMKITDNLYSVDQCWWGYPTRKRTYLYFSKCKPLSYPICGFPYRKFKNLTARQRSETTVEFCQWLISCVTQTHTNADQLQNLSAQLEIRNCSADTETC